MDADIDAFRDRAWEQGRLHHRSLPWRYQDDPYAVLVSEVMLQQTQVSRVLSYWPRWMAAFPTVDALAAADTATVLEHWQGLGYNRRALALKRACETCARERAGALPEDYESLIALPGVGPATAAGVRAFAFGVPGIYLETNVRAVFIHEFFPGEEKVSDRQLRPYVEAACPDERVREWYYALLDWGAQLKKEVANPTRRSAHYARQSRFEGSRRQKRASALRAVLADPGIGVEELFAIVDAEERAAGRGGLERAEFDAVLAALLADGFFRDEGGRLRP